MNIHHNARLTPLGRERMVRAVLEGGQTPQAAARAAGVCPRTARKWVARFKAEGRAGLADRSSRPKRLRRADETAQSAIAFLKAAIAFYESLGVTVARVMTDNGSCYKAFAFARSCKRLKLKHIRTKPYTPKTNGKAERFIQTALREWAYARPYPPPPSEPSSSSSGSTPIIGTGL